MHFRSRILIIFLSVIIPTGILYDNFEEGSETKQESVKADLRDKVFFSSSESHGHIISLLEQQAKGFNNLNGREIDYDYPYYFTHLFYIPIQYSFDTENFTLIEKLSGIINYEVLLKVRSNSKLSDMSKRAFYFACSEYLRRIGIKNREQMKMYNLIKSEVSILWNKSYANIWSTESKRFFGVKERLAFILSGKSNGSFSYYRAVTDFELFLLGTGVSLAIIERNNFGRVSEDAKEMSQYFYDVLLHEVQVQPDKTWYLQPGVWHDHPTYKDVIIKANGAVNWDSSHFSRMPAYLFLLGIHFREDNVKSEYIEELKAGLAHQFTKVISHYNPVTNQYHFNNFIDGNNSFFKSDLEKGIQGVKPSSDFVHVFWSWWKMLQSKEVQKLYQNIGTNYQFYSDNNLHIHNNREFFSEVINLR